MISQLDDTQEVITRRKRASSRVIMKKAHYILGFILFYALWVIMITSLFANSSELNYPILRARFGTIMHHSSDGLGEVGGAVYDPNAVAHIYCYYPKAEAESKLIIKRQDDGDCSNWYGQIIFYESSYVSEREKYWWSNEQHIQDCADCDDLKLITEKH